MGTDAWITLGVLALVMGMLALTRIAPYLVLLAGLTVLFTLRMTTICRVAVPSGPPLLPLSSILCFLLIPQRLRG